MAEPAPIAEKPPLSASYRADQQYLFPTTQGVNAFGVRLFPGGFGEGVRVADLEYSWNLTHQDLPPITTLGGANAVDPFSSTNHGTAVIGQLFARENGFGITGAVPSCVPYVAPVNFTTGYNLAGAVTTTTAAFRQADVIVIEQQLSGPNRTNTSSDVGYIPVEWNRGIYNAVVTAIGNGVHVVMAAGNGFQNLDAAVYGTGNGGHYPFQSANDSGAIIVGAGCAAVNGSSTARSRLDFSNYGSRVNLQGWGENVVTLGYGGRYSAEGMNLWYTGSFNGTSSATPIVAGAVAVYHSVLRAYNGATPAPNFTRSFLTSFGAAQTTGTFPASQNIGPLPDVLATLNGTILFAPANNACGSATVLPAPGYGYTTGRLSGATLDGSASCTSGTTNVSDVWYRYTAQGYPGTLWLSTCGTNDSGELDTGIDTVMTVYSACGGTELGCNDDDFTNPTSCGFNAGLQRDSALALSLTAGQSVVIRVANYSNTPKGAFAMNWLFLPAGDLCSTAVDISGVGPTATTLTGNLINARVTGTSSCGTAAANGAIWYTHTACSDGTLTLTTCGTHDFGGTDLGVDTVVTAFAGCGGAELACNDDAPNTSICSTLDQGSTRDSYLSIPTTAGQQIVFRVSRYSSSPLASGTVKVNASFSANNDCAFNPIAAVTGANTFCNRGTPQTYFGLTEAVCAPANNTIYNAAWLRWVAPSSGPVVFDTCGSSFDTKIAVYQGGCPIFNNQAVAC
ncbi:MAG: S8 family serine peptidase, partial [Phycisphaerales bacterium]|nr:S8 family serine peptidase [Phycisphaerales bacterium]